jgi:hypothetical protein
MRTRLFYCYNISYVCVCYRLLVLLAFWPEARMHSGISSSSYDAQELLPEIAGDVADRALLSIEQRR